MRSPAGGSLATVDPANDVERQQALRNGTMNRSIENEPMEVQSRGRLYTTRDIRRRLGCNDEHAGRGTQVTIRVHNVERHDDWVHANAAAFHATLATDGVIRIPAPVRDELNLSAGDSVRVSIRNNDYQ